MRTTKIQISPEMREFNDAIEQADVLFDYQFDTLAASELLDRLHQAKCYPATAEWLADAMAGMAVKKEGK